MFPWCSNTVHPREDSDNSECSHFCASWLTNCFSCPCSTHVVTKVTKYKLSRRIHITSLGRLTSTTHISADASQESHCHQESRTCQEGCCPCCCRRPCCCPCPCCCRPCKEGRREEDYRQEVSCQESRQEVSCQEGCQEGHCQEDYCEEGCAKEEDRCQIRKYASNRIIMATLGNTIACTLGQWLRSWSEPSLYPTYPN